MALPLASKGCQAVKKIRALPPPACESCAILGHFSDHQELSAADGHCPLTYSVRPEAATPVKEPTVPTPTALEKVVRAILRCAQQQEFVVPRQIRGELLKAELPERR